MVDGIATFVRAKQQSVDSAVVIAIANEFESICLVNPLITTRNHSSNPARGLFSPPAVVTSICLVNAS